MLSSSFSSLRHVRSRPTLAAGATTSPTSENQQSSSLSLHATASFYEILGIPASASILEIKIAYRRLARVCHPDAATVTGGRNVSSDEFMKIHAAYSTLSDPEKRSSYDRSLHQRRRIPLTATTPESRFPGYGGRRWETDQCW
ncbi:hypothetical protein S83_000771 [Arachis hypogaea]